MAEYFPGSRHVYSLSLAHLSDIEIWKYAGANNYAIITKDRDFYHFAMAKGHPPKIIWVIAGNCRNENMLKILVKGKADILRFMKKKKDILILR